MPPFIKVTVALVVAGAIVVCAQDKSSSKTEPHPANQMTVAHQVADSTVKPVEKTVLVPQKTCPVMGDPIDKSIFVDYKGKRVYFCCGMCPATFSQDPEKYLKVLADKGEAAEEIGKK